MIFLLLFVSLTLTTEGQATCHGAETQLASNAVPCVFVLVRDSSICELTPQVHVRETVAVTANVKLIAARYFSGAFIHKSNASFMSRRNCVCIPLRL